MPTRGIPFPTGDPSLDPAAEHAWRRRLLEKALEAVATSVSKPTIFDVDPSGPPERTRQGPSGPSERKKQEPARA